MNRAPHTPQPTTQTPDPRPQTPDPRPQTPDPRLHTLGVGALALSERKRHPAMAVVHRLGTLIHVRTPQLPTLHRGKKRCLSRPPPSLADCTSPPSPKARNLMSLFRYILMILLSNGWRNRQTRPRRARRSGRFLRLGVGRVIHLIPSSSLLLSSLAWSNTNADES